MDGTNTVVRGRKKSFASETLKQQIDSINNITYTSHLLCFVEKV